LPSSESCADLAFGTAQAFAFHTLDLRPSLSDVFSRLHKDGIQRKIRRADRDGLEHEAGQSDQLLRQFFGLLTITRRRHRVPPQPFVWFQHLRDCLADRLRIHVALKNKQAVAAIVTLRHRNTLYYKYGGSDADHHQSGAMPFLLWKAIQDGKDAGLQTLDLGRSDLDNAGLITFKQRWGTTPATLTYLRYPEPSPCRIQPNSAMRFARELVPLLPYPLLIAAGKLLYRHVG
jgi:lipid II:glycine glycyltransferase (peptidoglycan interpeptide bridge formation enzyme)